MTYQPFVQALLWNALNVFLYKIILQVHQACLFYVINKELFGISGTLFSTMYLLISISNFGFDYSLFAFYRYYIGSKSNFNSLARQFIVRIILLLTVTALLLVMLRQFEHFDQISFITQHISSYMMPVLISIFISESLKKSLELFAHISFLNKTITIIEIITLLSYIGIVWSYYLIYGFINLYVIFIPMAITSWFELCILLKRIALFYNRLPETAITSDYIATPSTKTILYNQAANYINQISKALFSPNFIIIFLAYHLGMTRAGYIKLIIDIIILLYMLLNRAVGIPSGALLSTTSGVDTTNPTSFKTKFLKITNGYIQFLYVLASVLICTLGPCLTRSCHLGSILITNILLFIFAGFLEYIIITYEKLYVTQAEETTLAWINITSLTALIFALHATMWLPADYLLAPFILVRCISIILIAYIAFKTWHVAPSFKIHKTTCYLIALVSGLIMLWQLLR